MVVSGDDETRHVTLVVERLSGESRDDAHYLVVFQPEPERGEEPVERSSAVGDEEVVRALEQELTNTKERLQTALEELARTVVQPFAEEDPDRLRLSRPRLRLRSNAAVPVAMILHELATDAVKYGAWPNSGGCVTLQWQTVQNDADHLRLTWTGKGGPKVKAAEEPGFGLQLVEQSTGHDLGGECAYAFERDGFSCTLDLPSAEVIASPEPDAGPVAC